MAGIYIHIPFCRQACHYCNFHFTISLRYKNEFMAALLKEITLTTHTGYEIETIYIGGGTPSLLDVADIGSLLKGIRDRFSVKPDAEVTLEANPDDISTEKLEGWLHSGINRLSIGIQSFFDEDLQWMNRAHNATQARQQLELALRYFNNITADLIYGSPGLSDEKWKSNVLQLTSLGVPHLSCYALTVEPQTPLHKQIRQQQSSDVDPDRQSAQFLLLMQWMREAGYEHYEISNFARPGFRSRHNSSYWQGKPYLGLGPSAHSYDGSSRWWNVANNTKYISSIGQGILPFEKEDLTPIQRWNEHIMIALRTSEGLHLQAGAYGVPASWIEELIQQSQSYIQRGLMQKEDNYLRLTNEGKLLADGIAADLFRSEND